MQDKRQALFQNNYRLILKLVRWYSFWQTYNTISIQYASIIIFSTPTRLISPF